VQKQAPDAKPAAVPDEVETTLVSRPLRVALLVAGFVFVGLAALGVVLPLVPTTPFLLIASACFARSSPRFYRILLGNRVFGPLIRAWHEHRAIPLHAKIMAISAITLALGSSIIFAVRHPALRIGLAAFGIGLCIWLWRLPTRRPDPEDSIQSP
jgi:uncharacterized membrane protein YbaN (DUF454 family)